MWMSLKRQYTVMADNWKLSFAMVIGSWLFGQALLWILIHVLGKEAKEMVPVGLLFAVLIPVFYIVTMMLVSLNQYFNLEVAMGSTRKQFFFSWYAVNLIGILLNYLVLLPLAQAEKLVGRTLYGDLEQTIDFFPFLLRYGVIVSIGIVICASFMGAFIMRLGKTGRYILLALWVVLCIGGPQIVEAVKDAPDSVFGRIGCMIAAIAGLLPGKTWAGIAVILCVPAFAGTWGLLRRQQVKA